MLRRGPGLTAFLRPGTLSPEGASATISDISNMPPDTQSVARHREHVTGSPSIESKYVLPLGGAADVLLWLEHLCGPDPAYDVGFVNTVYFDTVGLRLYAEKRASDYLKWKFRLRWYESADGERRPAPIPGFLELKRKIGRLRQKVRREVELQPEPLAGNPVTHPSIAKLSGMAQELGFPSRERLTPTVHLRYKRHRFLEPLSASRVALDGDLQALHVEERLAPGVAPLQLDLAVLEIKGQSETFPRALTPVLPLLLGRMMFSKYAYCLELAADRTMRRV